MLALAPLGMRPLCMTNDLPLPATIFAAQAQTLVYTLEIFDPESGARVIAAATQPFITLPTDNLSNYFFDGTLTKALSYHREVISGQAFNGMASGYGDLEVDNLAGDHDALGSLAGGRLICKAGWIGFSFDTYQVLLDGFCKAAFVEQGRVRIEVEDNWSKLDVPAQGTVFSGAGGAEGGTAVAQKRKPLAFGFPKNITPVFVDTVNLVYAVSDGSPILEVTEVRDRGVVLDVSGHYASYAALVAASIPGGFYATCLAEGLIRLGEGSSALTCDVSGILGDVNGTGETIVRTTGQVVRYLLESAGVQLDVASFVALDTLSDASIDYYLDADSNKTVGEAVGELLAGADCFGGFRRDGVYDVGRIDVPDDANIAATYHDYDMFAIERLALPSDIDPPPWRLRVIYRRNWTIQTDLADGAFPATVAFAAAPYELVEASDADVLAANPRAQDPEPRKSFYSDASGAGAEVNRLFGLLSGAPRKMFRVELSTPAFKHNLGATSALIHPRFELSAGETFVVVGVRDEVSSADELVELTVAG